VNPNHPMYAIRRKHLLSQFPDSTMMIVPGATVIHKSRDTEFPFRQDSDFFYLTGFVEAEACLILIKQDGRERSVLFLQPKHENEERWTGPRLGAARAVQDLAVDEAYDHAELETYVTKLLGTYHNVVISFAHQAIWQTRIWDWIEKARSQVKRQNVGPHALHDLDGVLHEMRVIKDEGEIAKMQRAATITAAAHRRAMQVCRPGMTEYQLEAEIIHEYIRNDARQPAYNSIVGAGKNACILHYTANNSVMQKDDLVLIDAGCEWNMYAADVTRTFPVSGKFEGAKRDLYQLVLASQLAGIRAITPGAPFDGVQKAIVAVLVPGLIDLGLLQGEVSGLIESGAYRQFYMHSSGHWLGLDVHDVGRYQAEGQSRLLEKGMVLTVEPGLYIDDNANVPAAFKGIGIRIEDDVLVEDHGFLVLSQDAPKTIADIEALMSY